RSQKPAAGPRRCAGSSRVPWSTDEGADMAEYVIFFNDEWVGELSDEQFREASRRVKTLQAEMTAAGVLIFTGGLDPDAPVFSLAPAGGTPLFSAGPFVESKEHLGGFAVVDVPDEEAARMWAAKVAVACGWPQEVHRFQVPRQPPESS